MVFSDFCVYFLSLFSAAVSVTLRFFDRLNLFAFFFVVFNFTSTDCYEIVVSLYCFLSSTRVRPCRYDLSTNPLCCFPAANLFVFSRYYRVNFHRVFDRRLFLSITACSNNLVALVLFPLKSCDSYTFLYVFYFCFFFLVSARFRHQRMCY